MLSIDISYSPDKPRQICFYPFPKHPLSTKKERENRKLRVEKEGGDNGWSTRLRSYNKNNDLDDDDDDLEDKEETKQKNMKKKKNKNKNKKYKNKMKTMTREEEKEILDELEARASCHGINLKPFRLP